MNNKTQLFNNKSLKLLPSSFNTTLLKWISNRVNHVHLEPKDDYEIGYYSMVQISIFSKNKWTFNILFKPENLLLIIKLNDNVILKTTAW